jgi:hypothetical protein
MSGDTAAEAFGMVTARDDLGRRLELASPGCSLSSRG